MEYQPIGFTGCGLVCFYTILSFSKKIPKLLSLFSGFSGSALIMFYSFKNKIWPTFITNSVLILSIIFSFFKTCNLKIEARNTSTKAVEVEKVSESFCYDKNKTLDT
tara:strand:+ start:67 stop:387 length:321 start_codon:yes stop_codon:yes gene_type:complete